MSPAFFCVVKLIMSLSSFTLIETTEPVLFKTSALIKISSLPFGCGSMLIMRTFSGVVLRRSSVPECMIAASVINSPSKMSEIAWAILSNIFIMD